MTDHSERTAGPWFLIEDNDCSGAIRIESDRKLIAEVGNAEEWSFARPEWLANAHFIVRACAMHDDLRNEVEALRNAVAWAVDRLAIDHPIPAQMPVTVEGLLNVLAGKKCAASAYVPPHHAESAAAYHHHIDPALEAKCKSSYNRRVTDRGSA